MYYACSREKEVKVDKSRLNDTSKTEWAASCYDNGAKTDDEI